MHPWRKPQGGRGDERDSPYCAFKDDRYRFWALLVRDIKGVLCTLCWAIVMAWCASYGLPVTSSLFKAMLTSLGPL